MSRTDRHERCRNCGEESLIGEVNANSSCADAPGATNWEHDWVVIGHREVIRGP